MNRLRAIRAAGLGVLAGCTAGCVSLQTSGPVTLVTQGNVGNSHNQIFPTPPYSNEPPASLVSGFLEAARSGPQNARIADAYLTGAALDAWKGTQHSVIVVADGTESAPTLVGGSPEAPTASVSITGDVVGTLDAKARYRAEAGSRQYTFELDKTDQGFRISSLPPGFGVLLQQTRFESEYAVHDVFFGNAGQNGQLIPSQVYLPSGDTDQAAAEALTTLVLDGVPERLGAAAVSGVGPAKYDSVEIQPNDTIQVTLDKNPCSRPQANCNLLALQLAATFADGLSTKVSAVRVVDSGDNASGQQLGTDFSSYYSYGIGVGGAKASKAYVIDKDGQVATVGIAAGATASPTEAVQVGPAGTKFAQVAQQPGQNHRQNLALVSQDGTHLYLVNQAPFAGQLHAVFTGTGISSLSWDQQGNLWFTAVTDGVAQVYRYGDGNCDQVRIDGLQGQVATVAAAPDSSRVAVSYQIGSDEYSIAIGTAQTVADGSWRLNMAGAQVVANSWTQVLDFGWYDEDSLAVLGIPASAGSLRLYQLYADGSPVYNSLTDQPVEANPATDTQEVCWNAGGQPIAATREGKLYELSMEGQDQQLLTAGPVLSPSY